MLDRGKYTLFSCNSLQKLLEFDIMTVYLSHGKGGYDASYGILDSRGGSKGTEGIQRCDMEAYQEKATDSLQSWGGFTHQARRFASVPGYPKNRQIRGKLTCKLALSAEVTRSCSDDWNPVEHNLDRNSCLFAVSHISLGKCKQARACYLFARKRDVM